MLSRKSIETVFINSISLFMFLFQSIILQCGEKPPKVNLIVGDNNSGKTSVLEALQLLKNPSQLANYIKIVGHIT